jgi:hypothetical protein
MHILLELILKDVVLFMMDLERYYLIYADQPQWVMIMYQCYLRSMDMGSSAMIHKSYTQYEELADAK